MIVLSATNQAVEALLAASSVAPLPIACSSRLITAADTDALMSLINSNGTTAVVAVAAPGSGERRVIDFISIYNPNVAAATVTIRINQGGSFFILAKVTLAQDERLQYTDAHGWVVLNSAGGVKSSVNQGNNPISSGWNSAVLGADVTNNNAVANSIADVTGLSFPVVAGQRYNFKFNINYTAAATTTGSRWTISGPAAPTQLAYHSQYSLTTTSDTFNNAVAYDIPAASNASSANTTGNSAVIEGFILPSVDGTVTARFASEIANSAIVARRGSMVAWLAV